MKNKEKTLEERKHKLEIYGENEKKQGNETILIQKLQRKGEREHRCNSNGDRQ